MFELKRFRKEHGLNQEDVAVIVDVTQAFISKIERGIESFPPSYLDKLRTKYGDVVDDYIVDDKINESGIIVKDAELLFPAKPFIENLKAVCGFPNGFENKIYENGHRLISLPINVDYDFAIEASGLSMINIKDPHMSIQPGDILALKIVTTRSHIKWGDIYTLATYDDIITKSIMPSEKENYIRCVSSNEEKFPAFDLPVDEITSWAMVKAIVSVKKL